jgi:hypothetical protein
VNTTLPPVIGARATVLAPFHYHSLAVPGGTATLPDFLTDRQISFAIAAALGCLSASPALPMKDYRAHMTALPLLASVFETKEARLLRPLAKRLNIDAEAGLTKSVQDATGTGNLKTYFFIQEVPPGLVYEGAIFGADPFALASLVEERPVSEIIVRTGRHLGGLLRLERAVDVRTARLNAHTAGLFGRDLSLDDGIGVEVFALHDLQVTRAVDLHKAAAAVGAWRPFGAAGHG